MAEKAFVKKTCAQTFSQAEAALLKAAVFRSHTLTIL